MTLPPVSERIARLMSAANHLEDALEDINTAYPDEPRHERAAYRQLGIILETIRAQIRFLQDLER